MANRYDIVTGNLPDIPEPESRIRTFGLDVDITDNPCVIEFFKGRNGESPRIAFVEDRKQMFMGTKVHWTGSGYIICKKADVNHVCCQRFGRSRWRVGSVIFRYDEVIEVIDMQAPKGKIMPWVFSERIYKLLHDADGNFPLDQHDYMVQCENDHYQTISLQPLGMTYINPAVIALYAEDIKKCRQQVRVALGFDLSEEEIQNFPDNRSMSPRQAGNRIPQRGRATRALTDSAETFFNDLLEE